MTLDEALAEIESLGPGDTFTYQGFAKKHRVARTTLRKHHLGQAVSRKEASERQLLLNPHEEAEFVQYIRRLTEKHFPPTHQMIINFATPLCRWEPSDTWVTRLLHRHPDDLMTAWTTAMENSRHKADNGERHRLYFGLLAKRVKEFEVLPRDTYNMDEKGFMIGVID
jgi:DNA-binding SARP family transcriptional activator